MPQVDVEAASKVTERLRQELIDFLSKNAEECARIAVNSDDPHVPVIGCVQMTMADAMVRYLIICGFKPEEALAVTVDMTQRAMQIWMSKFMKPVPQKKKSKLVVPKNEIIKPV